MGALEIGRFNVSDSTETYETHVYEQVVKHPRYIQQSQNDVDEFDYALVKIYDTTQLDNITPVTLNTNPNVPSTPQQELLVVGWGKPDLKTAAPRSNVLRVAEVFYIVNEKCKTLVSSEENISLEDNVFDITLCAGDFEERDDSCTGDSGGPIILPASGDSPTNDVQVGVTSYGFGCAHAQLPGIYARVSYVQEWIQENVCRISLNPPANFNCPSKRVSMEPDWSGELVDITVSITLQEFAESETGWILQSHNDDDVLVTYAYMPIGSYAVGTNVDTSRSTTALQVPNNRQYTFTLFDSYGNGGSGVTIRDDASGDVLLSSMEDFSFSTSHDFVLGTLPSMAPTVTPAPTTSQAPSMAPTVTPPMLLLEIQLDDYPEETGWRLEVLEEDDDYRVLQQVYPGTYANVTSVEETIPLLPSSREETYKFTITDNERDGLCCEGGIGYYELWLQPENRLIAEGSEFIWEESTVFTVTVDTSSSATIRRSWAAATLLWMVIGAAML